MLILPHVCFLVIILCLTYASAASISCTFDSGLCGWHGVEGSSFHWKNHSGPSPDRTSGPLNDHTCNNFNGQYIYISGDDAESKADEAILESNNITLNSSTVLEFWYLMNGIGIGKLRLIRISAQNEQQELWSMSGKKAKKWTKASVKLQSGQFSLRFMATANLPYSSDLAIDDTRLMSELYDEDISYCERTTTSTSTTTTTTTTKSPTTHKPTTLAQTPAIVSAPSCSRTEADSKVLPGSCDFETDMCGFKVTRDNNQLSWIRTQNKVGYGETQIPGGHSGNERQDWTFFGAVLERFYCSRVLLGSCDFETDMCGFKVTKDNYKLSWIRTQDKVGYGETQIPCGHSGHGYYMRYDKGGGFLFSNPSYSVRLESPLINETDVCLSFWYIMPYKDYSNLRVYVKTIDGNLTQIWARQTLIEKQTNKWYLATMSIQENQPFQIIFSSKYNHGLTRVGIDDVSILGSVVSNVNDADISCSFDFGFCGWNEVGNSSFQWRNHSGPSPDKTSGPQNDHTCNNFNGQYIYTSGDDAESKADEAILESNNITLNSPTVLEFWYLMNGIGIGKLRLFRISAQSEQQELWSMSGKKDRKWTRASVKLQPGQFTLRFMSTANLPYSSDLAIDDIRLMSEQYDEDKSYCGRTTTTTSTTTTTTTQAPTTLKPTTLAQTTSTPAIDSVPSCSRTVSDSEVLPGSCDFESDMCGFKITRDNNKLSWIRTQDKDGYGDKQIPGGHSGQGYYMRFDKGGGFMFSNPSYNARLESPLINETDVCLSFWYIMPYEKYSNLRVYVKSIDGNLTQIWARQNFIEKHTNKWHLATMTIQEDHPFQIVFSTRYNLGLSRVGIDDVSILGESLYIDNTTMIPTTTQTHTINSTTTTYIDTATPLASMKMTTMSRAAKTTMDMGSTNTPVDIGSTNTPIDIGSTNTPVDKETTTTLVGIGSTSTKVNMNFTISIGTVDMERTTAMVGIGSANSTVNMGFTKNAVDTSSKITTTSEKSPWVSTEPISEKPKPINNTKNILNHSSKYKSISNIVGATVGSLISVLFLTIVGYFIYKSIQTSKKKNNVENPPEQKVSKDGNKELKHLNGGLTHIIGDHSAGKVNGNINNGYIKDRPLSNGNALNGYISNGLSINGHIANGNITNEHITNGDVQGRNLDIEELTVTRL